MTVRIIFRCSRCGSRSFRPSSKWTFKVAILRKIGLVPQRCYLCRRRFYVFRPAFLSALLKALDGPPLRANEANAFPRRKPMTIELSRFADSDPRESRSQTASENLAG